MPTETATPEPTETPLPTETPTPLPTETPEPTETAAVEPSATMAPTETATAEPASSALTAQEAKLPATIEVQNTTYVFSEVVSDVDLTSLVRALAVTVEGVDIRIFAANEFQGVARELYFVTTNSQHVGRYVVAAAAQPVPPAGLPAFVDVDGTTYVFNELDLDIDMSTLESAKTIVVQSVELTVYAETGATGIPTRIFVVTPDGATIGQYVQSSLVDSLLSQATPEAEE